MLTNLLIAFISLNFFTQITFLRDEVYITDNGVKRKLEFSDSDLVSFTFDFTSIPGFFIHRGFVDGKAHTYINLNVGGDKEEGSVISRISRSWLSENEKERITVEVVVFEDENNAVNSLNSIPPRSSSAAFVSESVAGREIGIAVWSNHPSKSGTLASCFFVVGRALIKVHATSRNTFQGVANESGLLRADNITENLSLAMEYELSKVHSLSYRRKSEILKIEGKEVSWKDGVVKLRSGFYLPASALEKVGIKATWNPENKTMRFEAKEKTFELTWPGEATPFNGKQPPLPLVSGFKEMIVPIERVCEGLGLSIEK
jgi:hypothetical protein